MPDTHGKPDAATGARVIARVLRDLLDRERFASLADLLDALKYRLGRLRIPWTNDWLNDALRWVDSNRPLIIERPRTRGHRPAAPPPIGREEATALLLAWHVADAVRRMR